MQDIPLVSVICTECCISLQTKTYEDEKEPFVNDGRSHDVGLRHKQLQ